MPNAGDSNAPSRFNAARDPPREPGGTVRLSAAGQRG